MSAEDITLRSDGCLGCCICHLNNLWEFTVGINNHVHTTRNWTSMNAGLECGTMVVLGKSRDEFEL